MMKFYSFCIAVLFSVITAASAFSQDSSAVKLSSSWQRINDKEVLLTIKATVGGNAKLYSVKKLSADAPYSEIVFDSSLNKMLSAEITESGQVKKGKESLLENIEVAYFTD